MDCFEYAREGFLRGNYLFQDLESLIRVVFTERVSNQQLASCFFESGPSASREVLNSARIKLHDLFEACVSEGVIAPILKFSALLSADETAFQSFLKCLDYRGDIERKIYVPRKGKRYPLSGMCCDFVSFLRDEGWPKAIEINIPCFIYSYLFGVEKQFGETAEEMEKYYRKVSQAVSAKCSDSSAGWYLPLLHSMSLKCKPVLWKIMVDVAPSVLYLAGESEGIGYPHLVQQYVAKEILHLIWSELREKCHQNCYISKQVDNIFSYANLQQLEMYYNDLSSRPKDIFERACGTVLDRGLLFDLYNSDGAEQVMWGEVGSDLSSIISGHFSPSGQFFVAEMKEDIQNISPFIPSLLLAGGETEKAASYLSQQYQTFSPRDQISDVVQYMLIYCYLHTKTPSTIYGLYGIIKQGFADANETIVWAKEHLPRMEKDLAQIAKRLQKNSADDSSLRIQKKALNAAEMISSISKRELSNPADYAFAFAQFRVVCYELYDKRNGLSGIETENTRELFLETYAAQDRLKQAIAFFGIREIQPKIDLRIIDAYKRTALQILDSVQELKTQSTGVVLSAEELERIEQQISEEIAALYYRTQQDYISQVYKSIDTFIRYNGLDQSREKLLSKLGNKREEVERLLCQNMLLVDLFEQLSSEKRYTIIDYSPALIELTKALEIVAHIIYEKVKEKNAILGEYTSLKSFYDCFSKKNRSALGALVNLDYLPNIGENIIIDEKGNSQRFKPNAKDHNCELMQKGLEHITKTYRNAAAHKEPVLIERYKEAEELILTTEKMLWILLAIMK